MSLHVNAEGGSFELIPAGVYAARCYRLVDMGTQKGNPAFGAKDQKKVMVSWELLDNEIKMNDGRPFAIHKTYTASLGEKANLRVDLEAWRNKKFTDEELKDFDLKKILGAYCQLQVVHSEDGKFANVQTIMAMRGEKPAPVNENVYFDIDEPDMAVFEAFSNNMKQKIMAAPEWSERNKETAAASSEFTDPFDEPVLDESQPDDSMPPDFLQYDQEFTGEPDVVIDPTEEELKGNIQLDEPKKKAAK